MFMGEHLNARISKMVLQAMKWCPHGIVGGVTLTQVYFLAAKSVCEKSVSAQYDLNARKIYEFIMTISLLS